MHFYVGICAVKTKRWVVSFLFFLAATLLSSPTSPSKQGQFSFGLIIKFSVENYILVPESFTVTREL